MHPLAPPLLALGIGLVLLFWSADRFVEAAAALARNLNVAPLVVGLVVVGFGTSAPELLVSAVAAWDGRTALGIGNALGSNIANVGLILGVAALARPLVVRSAILRRELPVPLAAMLLALALMWDGTLGRPDALALLAAFLLLVYGTVRIALRERHGYADPISDPYSARKPATGTGAALGRLTLSFVVLVAASRAVVWGAEQAALWWGVSDLVVGLSVVAVGTSLPELAASVAAARKGLPDIAIGNVVGSNTFNTLAAVGVAGVIGPGPVDPQVLTRDFPVMIALTLVLFGMAHGFGRQGRITRAEGAVLLIAFAAYLTLLARAAPA